MKKSERCLAILEILQKQHKVSVNELAQRFGISEMTVRRDLNSLACQYNISRTRRRRAGQSAGCPDDFF